MLRFFGAFGSRREQSVGWVEHLRSSSRARTRCVSLCSTHPRRPLIRESLPFVLSALLLGAVAPAARADDYPTRHITLVVPFPAGSGPDVYARLIADKLAPRLGQPVVIENRAGGGGTTGGRAVASAAPDGYTLLFGSTSSVVVAPAVARESPYDPVTAFTPIIQVARGPFLLSVRSDLQINNLAELIAYAKRNPGKLNYGTSGPGSLHHLSTEILKRATGIDMVHIPFPGGAQSWTALQSGVVDMIFDSMPGPISALQSGKARAIAVTGTKHLADLPGVAGLANVPTFEEQGVKGIDVIFWFGILAPAGTPASIIAKLNAALAAVLTDPDLQAKFAQQSIEPAPGTVGDFGQLIAQQARHWQQVVKDAGAKQE
jgi:tripartite-type tricarboxylate transporter receptor subunit TctC